MSKEIAEALANALDNMADTIAATPINVTGMHVEVTAGPGAGPTTGVHVVLNVDGEVKGNVAALKVEANAAAATEITDLIGELREAAAAVRDGTARKNWLKGLLGRVGKMATHALEAATVHAANKLVDAAF